MSTATARGLDFPLPTTRQATRPPEHRGIARDRVRLLVARPDLVTHTRFDRLGDHLVPGDVVVVNTTTTMPAALDGRIGHDCVVVHLSSRHDESWEVELRRPDGTGPWTTAVAGDRVALTAAGTVELVEPAGPTRADGTTRLWLARVDVPGVLGDHLATHGRPITYAHAPGNVSLDLRQTVFARWSRRIGAGDPIEQGASAEMASAARPFTPLLVTDLVRRGIVIAPITLHAGVSSLDRDETPRPEPFEVPAATAALATRARATGHRVVAVGTTVVRALESTADEDGVVTPTRGWTQLVLGPDRPARVTTGLVTGWHPPGASHLLLLEAVAGRRLVGRAYDAALSGSYLWHEFGDSCLFLP